LCGIDGGLFCDGDMGGVFVKHAAAFKKPVR
jgi:hypothetical protein